MAEENSVTASDSSASVQTPEDTQGVSNSAQSNISESLNFKELIPMPSKQEDRNGMSRREWQKETQEIIRKEIARANGTYEGDDNSDRGIDEESILSKLDEKFGLSKISELEIKTKSAEIESYFNKTLDDKGISPRDFNSSFKPVYEKQFKALVEDGLDPHKAARYALDFAVQGYQGKKLIEESDKRAEARSKMKTSPDSSGKSDRTEITEEELSQLPFKEYSAMRDKIQKGMVRVIPLGK